MSLTRKTSDLTIKSTDDATREISGYASTFNGLDSYGDSVSPGAFTQTIAEHQAADTPIPILFEHNKSLDSHVGQIVEMSEDDTGLFVRAQLDDTDPGRRAYNLAKSRRVKGLSIGFYPSEVEPGEVDGQPATVIKSIDLREVSLVLNPADPRAQITSVKSGELDTKSLGAVSFQQLKTALAAIDEGTSTVDIADMVTKQSNYVQLKTNAAAYHDAIAAGDRRGPYKYWSKLPEEHLQAAEDRAVVTIARNAVKAGRSITLDEADRIDRIKKMRATREADRKSSANFEAIKKAMNHDHDHEGNTPTMNTNARLPITLSEKMQVATKAAEGMRTKAMQGASSGTLYVPTTVSDVVSTEGAPILALLDMLPAKKVEPSFYYVKQTARDLKAAVVPVGEAKPVSNLGFQRVDASLGVVAHIVQGLDEYLLRDEDSLQEFIAQEMITGLLKKLTDWSVDAMLQATGHLVQKFATDSFTTIRMAIAGLQATGLQAGGIVLHPNTWAQIETTKASGSGQFVFNGAPVDQTKRTLWGVPVVTATGIAEDKAIAVDLSSVQIAHDGRLALNWHASETEFTHNQVSLRAEGRFQPLIKRSPGIVECLLTAEATQTIPAG